MQTELGLDRTAVFTGGLPSLDGVGEIGRQVGGGEPAELPAGGAGFIIGREGLGQFREIILSAGLVKE